MRTVFYQLGTCLLAAFCLWAIATTMLRPVVNWSKASDWEGVPATLDRAEIIKTGHGSRDKKLLVSYHYQWGGVVYQNDRATVYPASISMPVKIQRSLLAQFKDQSEQNTIRAYVNPEEPAESALTRSFFPGWYAYLFYLLMVTLYFVYGAYWLLKLNATSEQERQIEGEQYESAAWKFVAYFAGMFSLFSAALVAIIMQYVSEGDYGVLAFLVFPAATIGLWWMVRYCWLHRFEPPSRTDTNKIQEAV